MIINQFMTLKILIINSIFESKLYYYEKFKITL